MAKRCSCIVNVVLSCPPFVLEKLDFIQDQFHQEVETDEQVDVAETNSDLATVKLEYDVTV